MISEELKDTLRLMTLELPSYANNERFMKFMTRERMREEGPLSDDPNKAPLQALKSLDQMFVIADEMGITNAELIASILFNQG